MIHFNFNKILNITNLIRIIVIFTVGFISRAFINYIDVNIYHDFIHTILSSFIISSIFIILITEYIYTDYIIFIFTKSIYPNIENIKICFIRKIINSYNSTTISKMHINDSSYKLNTIYGIRRRSFNPGDLWEDRIRERAELNLPSFRSLNLPPSVYKNEWALANDNRGKDNWDECKFKSTFLSKCNNDFQNFIDKNKNSIKSSENRLKKNCNWFANSLYKGHSLDYALKSLPVGMRDSYKQYLLDLEKTRNI